jgi:hypothetical protein
VVSEEVGECEFWGGISGCTSGYGKRVTKRYSDSSLKVSYSCCDPLQPNLKYYCTLRPFSTGACLNELKSTDFTGTVVAGQGEWVCEALGITSYPSCSTTENCIIPKTSVDTYEACGYLGTGQRLVTTRTFQSWCDITQDTVIGDCIGEIPKCGGAYCGEGSGEEEYNTGSCASGTGVRYKCVTPEGCEIRYDFRRCIPVPPQEIIGTPVTRYTEVCYTTAYTDSPPVSCRQFLSYTGSGTPGTNCTISGTSGDQFIPCPDIPGASNGGEPQVNCPVLSTGTTYCTTDGGLIGTQTIQTTPDGCEDIYGPCVAVTGSNPCSQIINTYSSSCDCPDGINSGTQIISETPGDCPNQEGACLGCPGTGPVVTVCNGTCTFGSGNQPCGDNGTQSYCITAVGCDDIYGFCNEPTTPTTPTEPPVVVLPPDFVAPCIWFCGASGTEPGNLGPKSVNVNTLVRTKDGLVAASDLKVGDKLLSADVESFPYDNLAATNMDLINWTAENPYVNLVETEIVGLRYRTAKWAVLVDSDIFSDTHYIMVKRGNETSFVKSLDLDPRDLIWSYAERTWLPISVLEKVDVTHEVVSIDCEPYDIFFTERMLTHDSSTVD